MKTKQIRMLLADDHPAVRAGIRGELKKAEDIVIIGEASTGEEILRLVAELTPDLLLLDMALPGLDGVEVTRRLRKTHPQVRILAFSGYADDAFVFGVLEAGAAGYLLKDEALERLVDSVRLAMHGEVVLSNRVAQKVTRQAREERTTLTPREWEVLEQLIAGKNTKQIATEMGVTAKTVGNHISNVLSKLALTSRAELVAHALREGMVTSGER
jgi:DNA-binding NarL/FixJ family response regulator